LIRAVIYWSLLFGVLLLAWWRGDRDTRIAATICFMATIGSLSTFDPWGFEARPVYPMIALIDLLTLAAFLGIAIRSDRFWPLWIAGLHLTATLSHVLRLFDPGLVHVAYEAAMRFWSYPLLVILGVAALRTRSAASSRQSHHPA
jgi:hypothetical protein